MQDFRNDDRVFDSNESKHLGESPEPVFDFCDFADELPKLFKCSFDSKAGEADSEKLTESILQRLSADERKAMGEAISKFKTARLDKSDQHQISEVEYRSVLKDIESLVNPDKAVTSRLNKTDRLLVAKQILELAACPNLTDQGRFQTCEVASLEKILLTRNPSAVSALISKAIQEGKIKNYDGSNLELSDQPFLKDLESSNHKPKDGERLLASQVFQTALIEREWSDRDIGFGKGMLSYRLCKPSKEHSGSGDGGERFIVAKGPDKGKILYDVDDDVPVWDPGIEVSRLGKMYNSLASKKLKDSPLVLASTDTQSFLDSKNRDSVLFIKDKEDLMAKLSGLKDKKQFPLIIVVVDIDSEDPEQKNLHVITIRDYDKEKGVATLDDQFGSGSKNIRISAADLMAPGGKEHSMKTGSFTQWTVPTPRVKLVRN